MVCAAGLFGCSSDGGDDWLSLWRVTKDAWEQRDADVSLQQAGDIPYATVGIRIDGGREQLLILATDNNGERMWTSASNVAITTRDGRVIRTAGLKGDLSGYTTVGSVKEAWNRPHAYDWTADFADLGYYSVPVHCNVRPAGHETIAILGSSLDTLRVDETCRSEKLAWDFNDTYWVDPESGRVWKSSSQVHPKGSTIELELLRPPLDDRP